MRKIALICVALAGLAGCKPAEPTLHDLMLDPVKTDSIVLVCARGSDSTLCPTARRARREREFLLTELRRSPEAFGLKIMQAQQKLASLELADAPEQTITMQREQIKELQFITQLAGE